MPTVAVNGQDLFYNSEGSGMPVVLLHGFPLDGRIFDDQLQALSDQFRVIIPDLPGFGRSQRTHPFTMESLADELHLLLGKIGALPCVLGGLSMGGYVSLAYLTRHPADLKALMLIDTKAAADTSEGKINRMKMIDSLHAGGAKAIADQMAPKMTGPAASPQVVAKARQIMEACPPPTIENALLAMRDRCDYQCELPSIAVPTLIIVGSDDALSPPAVAQAMAREIPHARLAIIPGAGHLSPMEQPQPVNQEIRAFLMQALR